MLGYKICDNCSTRVCENCNLSGRFQKAGKSVKVIVKGKQSHSKVYVNNKTKKVDYTKDHQPMEVAVS